ncbi:sigma-54-dependent Fis family transcriptional regulator [Mailhella massiliensis]|uniref:sigma-54-dependent Fis family transcriptional regulator n=1 Tax=Mailhella massiliensis TaxID=1903261 RepID=UPI002354E9FB|nr:sigma 54-interacting transcriptional regulator [Mailhella massiliensis]
MYSSSERKIFFHGRNDMNEMLDVFPHSIGYVPYIREQWERFQNGDDVRGKVRSVIYDSWQRCRAMGLKQGKLAVKNLPNHAFKELIQKESELIEVGSTILEQIFHETNARECMFALCNAEGVILKSFVNAYDYVNTAVPGSIMSEDVMGTAGIATCLKTGSSVEVYAAEHYLECFHDQVCMAEPIYHASGRIIGAISVSSHYKFFHKYSHPLIRLATRSITEQLRLRKMVAERQQLLESLDEGVISLDGNNRIVSSNSKARSLLFRPTGFLPDELAFFLKKNRLWNLLEKGKAFSNEEATIALDHGRQAFCTLSFSPDEFRGGGILTLRETAQMRDYAFKTVGFHAIYRFDDIIGSSRKMTELRATAGRIAALDSTVLIQGEGGTGKELFAQAIHNASPRRKKPFVAINCGALPRELVQMELFGYADGAFTGASRGGKPGKLELADGGTIFLDEIGEIPPEAQVSLLRVLQNSEVMRIGGKTIRKLDVRVIAATNRDLSEAIKEKSFREDLYFRLNVFSLYIPPLRERLEDMEELVRGILINMEKKNIMYGKYNFSKEAILRLQEYQWPGNIRELEHCIERTVYFAKKHHISPDDIMNPLIGSKSNVNTIDAVLKKYDDCNNEYKILDEALRIANGDVIKASKLLNIGKTKMYQLLQIHGITAKQYRKLKIN